MEEIFVLAKFLSNPRDKDVAIIDKINDGLLLIVSTKCASVIRFPRYSMSH